MNVLAACVERGALLADFAFNAAGFFVVDFVTDDFFGDVFATVDCAVIFSPVLF